MKIAIYIENGLTQLVLTPMSEYERYALKVVSDSSKEVQIHRGAFYACHGGWIRESQAEDSTILVITDKKPDGSAIEK